MDWSFKWRWMSYFNWISSTGAHPHWTAAVCCIFISSCVWWRCKILLQSCWGSLPIFRWSLSFFAVTRILSDMNSLWKTNWLIHSGRRTINLWCLVLRKSSWIFQIVLAARTDLWFTICILQFSGSSSCICDSSRRRGSRSWAFSWCQSMFIWLFSLYWFTRWW
jgi:hypothetical protein